ncbi:MAG: hypothetical protein KatS3mg061_1923 [Dehalococcoidia bacterium]|nr:MAG: hypothetical protein KatS3mg061_1923 [Dehalococcoidia bacterium]
MSASRPLRLPLAVVSDELSSDLETACELAAELGIGLVEIRGIGSERFPRVASYWKARLSDYLAQFGLQVISLSPGLFKIPLAPSQEPRWPDRGLRWRDWERHISWARERALLEEHLGPLLEESLDWAVRLGCRFLSCFSFLRPPEATGAPCPELVYEVLGRAAERAAAAGVMLLLENEQVCWGDTGAAVAAILRQVGHSNLGLLWDPRECLHSG